MSVSVKPVDDNYIFQLTWLRGLAAFFVIVSHTFRATEVKYSENDEVSSFFLLSLFDLGSFGVVLFFALSGCTLFISNASKVGFNDLGVFYVKRFFRIWPAFAIAIIFYISFRWFFSTWYIEPQGLWVEKQFLLEYSIYDLISYLTFTSNFAGSGGYFNNAFWSLPVEFQYYIIFPVIIASLKFGALGPMVIGVVLYFFPKLGLIIMDDNVVFLLAFSFCGGVMAGYLYNKYPVRLNPVFGLVLFTGLLGLASAISQSYLVLPDLMFISSKSNWYSSIAIVSVYIVLVTKINLHNKLEAFLKHYGTISYSTYLYHNLFVAIAVLFIINFEIYDKDLRLFITFVFTLLASYFVASWSYKFVEMPSINIGRNIIKKYSKR